MLRNRPLIVVNGVENIKEIFVRHADCVSDRPDHHYMTIMAKIDKGRKAVILLEEISLQFLPVISMFLYNTGKGNFKLFEYLWLFTIDVNINFFFCETGILMNSKTWKESRRFLLIAMKDLV